MDGGEVAALLFGLACIGLVLLLALGLPLYSLIVGFRRRHRAQHDVATAEPQLARLVRTTTEAGDHRGPTTLVTGNVAYAADFPSRWATQWRNLVGGKATSLSEQADLARRIAMVRMLEEADRMGASGVANVRMTTSEIFSGNGQRGALVIELLAYGTALLPPAQPPTPTPPATPPTAAGLPFDEPTRVRPRTP
jgi:uncharacterized protein YbjQ (UPF0145 family)